MAYKHTQFPELRPEHFNDAKLFVNRHEMIKGLGLPAGGAICEVGVAHGEFSQFLIETLKPAQFVAIDLFEMEKYPVHWGVPQEVLLQGKTHHQFYRDRFASMGDRMTILRGLSFERLQEIPHASCDMIYIDAAHDYENVKRDAELSQHALKADGTLIFNDYVMYDPFIDAEYGVVQAVNEFIVAGGWSVVGFALQHSMFCDIAIRRT